MRQRGNRMEKNGLIELIIQERLSMYFRKNLEYGREEVKRSDDFLALLKENVPDLSEEFQTYLDWTAIHSGEEQKGIYLFGIHDGIRLMQDIIS